MTPSSTPTTWRPAGPERFSGRPLHKVEKGDPGVSLGVYATVLFVLGLEAGVGDLADARRDVVGLDLEAEALPKRIRARHPRNPAAHG